MHVCWVFLKGGLLNLLLDRSQHIVMLIYKNISEALFEERLRFPRCSQI